MYLAAQQDVVMKSVGSTISWTKLTNAYASKPNFIACEANNPDVVYAGVTGDLNPLRKSEDGGVSWFYINYGITNHFVKRLTISPFDNSILYVGAQGGETGLLAAFPPSTPVLFKSLDGGANWSSIRLTVSNLSIEQIVFDPVNPLYQYFGATRSDGGVFRTEDKGNTWYRKISGMESDYAVTALAITPQSTNILYAGTSSSTSHIYKTTNRGDSWTTVYTAANTTIKDISVDPFSASTIYAATSSGVLKSTNSGLSWAFYNTGLVDLDIRTIKVDPNTANLIYIGTSTKFYYSTNSGATWIEVSSDIVPAGGIAVYNNDVYYMTGIKTSPILASKLTSGSSTWQILAKQFEVTTNFSAKDLEIDPFNSNKLYAVGRRDCPYILCSTNGGITWVNAYSDNTASGYFNSIAIDPNLSSKIYAVSDRNNSAQWHSEHQYSTDYGVSWSAPSGSPGSADFNTIAYDKNSGTIGNPSQKIYSAGGFYFFGGGWIQGLLLVKSTNAGVNWSTVYYDNTARHFTSFVIDPNDPDVAYAAFKGDDNNTQGGVLKTVKAWNSYFLLSMPETGTMHHVIQLLHHPKHSNVLLMVEESDPGVWKVLITVDGGRSWSDISSGLPSNYRINHLAYKTNLTVGESPQYVYAATNNGVYKIDLDKVINYTVASTWNMLSVPDVVNDFTKTAVWPTAISTATWWDPACQCYVVKNTLDNGKGYFVKFSSIQNVSYIGWPFYSFKVKVSAGWNMIGSLSNTFPTSSIIQDPPGIVNSAYFKYDNGYKVTTVVEPGMGIWVKISQDGTLDGVSLFG